MAAPERDGEDGLRPLPAAARHEDDILDEATRKDLFTDTFSKVCGVVLQAESQRTSHYKGKKHAKKVHQYIRSCGKKDERQEHSKQKKRDCIRFQMDRSGVVDETKYCNLCNMFFTSPVIALSHYSGKVHSKKLKQLSGDQARVPALHMHPVSALQRLLSENPSLPSTAEESLSSSNIRLKLNVSDKYCKLCSAPFSHPLVAQQHYAGKRHRRNEARKKILEELRDKTFPAEYSANAIGVGYYVCPVCNITVTSIETYLSHVQGSKHRTNLYRERVLVSLRKKSKKTHDSVQDELTFKMDYIKVQKATGLEPGKTEEFQDKNAEGRRDLGEVVSSNIKCEQGQHCSLLSEIQSPANIGDNRLVNWPSAWELALEEPPNCHCNKDYCKEEQEEQACEVAIIRDKSFSLSIAESEDCYKFVLAETSTSFYRTEQKFQLKHSEKKECISEELKNDKEATKQKRKKNNEGADFRKENEKPKRIKFETDLVNEEKSRPYKDKRLRRKPAKKKQKALKG